MNRLYFWKDCETFFLKTTSLLYSPQILSVNCIYRSIIGKHKSSKNLKISRDAHIAIKTLDQNHSNTVVQNEIEQRMPSIREIQYKTDYFVHEASFLYIDRNEFLNSVTDQLISSDEFEFCTFRCEYLEIVYLNELGLDGGGLRRDFFTLSSQHFFNPASPSGLFEFVEGSDGPIHVARSFSKLTPLKKNQYIAAGMLMGLGLVHEEWFGFKLSKLLFYAILNNEQDLEPPLELLQGQIDSVEYQSLISIRDQTIDSSWDLVFEYKGEQLIRKGKSIAVTEENKKQYLRKIFNWYVFRNRSEQLKMLRQGLYRIIDKEIIVEYSSSSNLSVSFAIIAFEVFLQLMLSGRAEIQVEDWRANTVVRNEHLAPHLVEYFWTFVESLGQEDRSRLLQFVTGSSSPPQEGLRGWIDDLNL